MYNFDVRMSPGGSGFTTTASMVYSSASKLWQRSSDIITVEPAQIGQGVILSTPRDVVRMSVEAFARMLAGLEFAYRTLSDDFYNEVKVKVADSPLHDVDSLLYCLPTAECENDRLIHSDCGDTRVGAYLFHDSTLYAPYKDAWGRLDPGEKGFNSLLPVGTFYECMILMDISRKGELAKHRYDDGIVRSDFVGLIMSLFSTFATPVTEGERFLSAVHRFQEVNK